MKGYWPASGQILVEISDVAGIIFESAQFFDAEAKIESEVRTNLPVILCEDGEIIGAIFVIKNATAAKTRKWRTLKEILEIGQAIRIKEKKLAIEGLREKFVEVDASVFAAKTKNVRALYPAYGIEEVVIILGLELVGWRRGAKLETGGTKQAEFVNGGSDVVGGAIDADICGGNRRIIDQTVLDAHVAEAEVVDEGGRKQMGFRDAEETAGNGQVVWEIQIGGADTAGQSAAERSLQTAGAEGQERLGVGEKETRGYFVRAAAEFTVPIGGELVVGVFAGAADDEGRGVETDGAVSRIHSDTGIRRIANGRKQEAAGIAELIALEIQKRNDHRINGDGNGRAASARRSAENRGKIRRRSGLQAKLGEPGY